MILKTRYFYKEYLFFRGMSIADRIFSGNSAPIHNIGIYPLTLGGNLFTI